MYVIIGGFLLMIGGALAVSDNAVFQGQYFENNEFLEGTFDFDFVVYDDELGGEICFSDSKILTTGFWGQWRAELAGISAGCNDTTKDYFMEIVIDNNTQIPRRRLTHFNYLRKDVGEESSGQIDINNDVYVYDLYVNNTKVCLADGTNCQVVNFSESDTLQSITDRGAVTNHSITIGAILNFILGGSFQEFVDRFLINKNLEIQGNVTSNYFIGDGSYLTGVIGQPGLQGIPGINGSQGPIGPEGPQGIQGVNGTNGIDGVDGVNGSQGPIGPEGPQGIPGTNGTNGIDGVDGTDGDTWFSLISGWLSYIGDIFINGNLNVTGDITSNNKLVCLEDGTNCPDDTNTNAETICSTDEVLLGNGSCVSSSEFGGGSGEISGTPVSFISTVDGDLKTGPKYLPLGTDAPISSGDDEASWIIDRDLTITGFLWNAKQNNMNKVAEIILVKSVSSKDAFSETSLGADIQGMVSGSATGSVNFLQGDLVAIKYSSSGSGKKKIKDLSITLIGTYD